MVEKNRISISIEGIMPKNIVICLIFFIIGAQNFARANDAPFIPEDKSSAVILSYGRVGEDERPDSNISIDQFKEHVDEILNGAYIVLPLEAIISHIQASQPLAPKTIAITFEGAYKSALKNAIPLLLEHNIPFTIFYAADNAAQTTDQYMTWKDLKSLSHHEEVSFGILPPAYDRLSEKSEEDIRSALNRALLTHRENFNKTPAFFSYPYGEYSQKYKDIIASYNFKAALTLNSGAISNKSDMNALPRFTITEQYGDLDRFDLITTALPLSVTDIEPPVPLLGSDAPQIGFSLPDDLKNEAQKLNCFISGQEKPDIDIINTRIEIRSKQAISDDRTRINCTLPGPDDRWRWFGILLINPQQDEPQ